MSPKRALNGAAAVVALVSVGASAATSAPLATTPQQQYRFTGWVGAGVGYAPRHRFVEGASVVLHFHDAANERPTRYRVCWSKRNGDNRRCWTRVARSFRVSSVRTAGPLLHFGSYVARWYVGRRVVASWPFLFEKEQINHP